MKSEQLPLNLSLNTSDRDELLKRWLYLMNVVLPNMASLQAWPISQNHCFMRVCLDTSLGSPWHKFVKRPATRHMTDNQLKAAIAVAEQIAETPDLLMSLNSASITQRFVKA